MMRTLISSLPVVLGLLGAVPAAAQEAGSQSTRAYVQAAGQSDAFEMSEAEAALTQSADPQVRAFAQRMIQDHGQLGQALRQATEQAGVMPPSMVVGTDQAPLLGALQSLRGPEFDQAYWRHQALAHRSALTVTQQYAATGDNPIIRRAASSAVPIISSHLAMAEQMAAKSAGS